ncbi:hypothetical protein [Streptomyces decoyicus]|uniref:hypothetical protein n=1 Tax=Streptomyces decoyicus TaxID=249567 RepID=UPI0038640016|nr:eS6 family ribosomal protein [Streptomyces decoyicus]
MTKQIEVFYDKRIVLVGGDGVVPGHLFCSFDGKGYTVRITGGAEASEHMSWNLFTALTQVRVDLEPEGLCPAVEGACRNVYPSRMALEMGGGRRAQRWEATGRPRTVDIFDDVRAEEYGRLASVAEQLVWIKERRGQRHE